MCTGSWPETLCRRACHPCPCRRSRTSRRSRRPPPAPEDSASNVGNRPAAIGGTVWLKYCAVGSQTDSRKLVHDNPLKNYIFSDIFLVSKFWIGGILENFCGWTKLDIFPSCVLSCPSVISVCHILCASLYCLSCLFDLSVCPLFGILYSSFFVAPQRPCCHVDYPTKN